MSHERKAKSPRRPSTKGAAYPIRAVSLMTGVSIDTLRAWERRYAAVTPVRDRRGRVYSEADIRRIRLLHEAVERGYAIGRIAALPDDHLAEIVETARPTPEVPSAGVTMAGTDVRSIVVALERFDGRAVERELSIAATLLPVPLLLRDLIVPLLAEIGARWHDGRGLVAHEHMLSASVRNVLGSLLRAYQKTGAADMLLFATPAGETHELGTLGAAVLAASGGLGVTYLGPNMPARDIAAVARVAGTKVVVLGTTSTDDTGRLEQEARELIALLDPTVELWFGGAGAARMAAALGDRVAAVPTYDVLEQQLTRLGASF